MWRSCVAFPNHARSRLTWNSATIAANGFRFRVPYGTLLCVSDKPLHGEIKLREWPALSTGNASTSTSKLDLTPLKKFRCRNASGCIRLNCVVL